MTRARTKAISFNWRPWAHAALVLLLAAAILLLFSHHAYADATGDASKCKDYPGVTNRIAACIRLTLQDVASQYFTGFYNLVQDLIWAFMTLAVIVYGVLTAGGMLEKPSRDVFVLVIKIGAVVFFTTNLDTAYEWELNMMDSTSAAVIQFIPQQGAPDGETQVANEVCVQNMLNQAAVPTEGNPVVAPWLAMDCILDSVIGLKKDDSQAGATQWVNKNLNGQGMARGLVAFFMTSAKTSVIGLLIGGVGFIFIYSLVFLIIKSLFTYIGAYIGLTFLMIIGPLFIPLVLFRPTSEYFNKWIKLIISFMLQPVLMLIFITLTITAVDLACYSGEYSIMYKIAGDASRQQGFTLNQYLKDHSVSVKKPSVFAYGKAGHDAPTVTKGTQQGIAQTYTTACTHPKDGQQTDPACGHDYPIQWWRDSLDWQKLADARSPAVQIEGDAKTTGEEEAREVLAAVIFAGIVVFVMNALLAVVPMVANDLIADYGVSPNLFAKMSKMPGQNQFTQGIRDMVSNMGTGRSTPK